MHVSFTLLHVTYMAHSCASTQLCYMVCLFEYTGVAVSKREVIICLEQNKEPWIVDAEETQVREPGNLK